MRDRSLWRHVLPAIFIITALILGPGGASPNLGTGRHAEM